MVALIEVHEMVEIYKSKRLDMIPYLGTFIFALWRGLEFGILVGIVVDIMFTLHNASRPGISFEMQEIGKKIVLIVRPSQNLCYSSAEYFKMTLLKKITKEFRSAEIIVIDGSAVDFMDSTVAKVLTIH